MTRPYMREPLARENRYLLGFVFGLDEADVKRGMAYDLMAKGSVRDGFYTPDTYTYLLLLLMSCHLNVLKAPGQHW